jgi:hypothetical protein
MQHFQQFSTGIRGGVDVFPNGAGYEYPNGRAANGGKVRECLDPTCRHNDFATEADYRAALYPGGSNRPGRR